MRTRRARWMRRMRKTRRRAKRHDSTTRKEVKGDSQEGEVECNRAKWNAAGWAPGRAEGREG
eukprot:8436750-Pyramimonas_sp.AAC.1